MTWFALVTSAVFTLLIAAIMLVMPALTRPTIPLGVSVPAERVADPVVYQAVRRFRTWIVIAAAVSICVTVILAFVSPFTATLVPTLLMVVLSMAAYVFARRDIQRAKRDQGWYDSVPVRLTGTVTPDEPVRVPIPVGWFVASLAVLAVVMAAGVVRYGSLPDPMPIHWNADGVANGFAPKSPWSVFGPVMIGVAMTVLLYIVSYFVRFSPVRRTASDTAEQARVRGVGMRHLLITMLGVMTLLVALLFAAITCFGWFFPTTAWFPAVVTAGFVAATAAVIAVLVVKLVRMNRAASRQTVPAAPPGGDSRPDAPDDDRYWKAGIFYVNRNDPAFMVPKRFGVGWTINMGHPAGWGVLGGLIALVVVVSVVVPLSQNGA